MITPVAELIKARNRPFIFATGYGSSGLPEEYHNSPSLQKPFQMETLAQVITSTLKSAPVTAFKATTVVTREGAQRPVTQYSRDPRQIEKPQRTELPPSRA